MKASFASLLVTVLSLSSCALAAPAKREGAPITIQLDKKVKDATDPLKLAADALARFSTEFDASKPGKRAYSPTTIKDSNSRLIGTATVGSNSISLIFDTGSPDLNLDNSAYTPGSSATDTGITFSNAYGEGETTDQGEVYLDTVGLGSTKTTGVPALRATTDWFEEGDGTKGIFGLSFPGNGHPTTYSTFLEKFFPQHSTYSKLFATWTGTGTSAELYLGGYDSTKYTGSITYASVDPEYAWWLIPTGGKINGKAASGLVDSGTPYIYAPTLSTLQSLASSLGLTVTRDSTNNIAYIETSCSNTAIKVSFNSLTRTIPNVPNGASCVLPVFSYNSNTPLANGNWIYGLPVYEQFFIVHDYGNKRVGFATPA